MPMLWRGSAMHVSHGVGSTAVINVLVTTISIGALQQKRAGGKALPCDAQGRGVKRL